MSETNDLICNLCQKPKSEHKTISDRDDEGTWLVCGEFEEPIIIPKGCVCCGRWACSPTEICGSYNNVYPEEWEMPCVCGHNKACHKNQTTLTDEGKRT